MKTKIFLPVLAMLSLMLFSFTTNTNSESSVRQLADGNFLLQNVALEDGDVFRLDQLTERISISGHINEETAARGIWIFRNKTHDDTKFTQKTFIGSSISAELTGEDLQVVEQAQGEINEMMQRYMQR
ncbi:hypothetical protein H2O64_10820 [Kordia sp. YSTF-M3]|uniref:Uncharacterized protein n=3 Tax=Kordia aestuariivivens TaxID=2759037 RepID=A0ABR7Q9G1_9FLAO|nr:hypothetical protein [Kordia aestuariivivens]MBC8755167.1 hypothetical protein [Kordia aestuariivivens]